MFDEGKSEVTMFFGNDRLTPGELSQVYCRMRKKGARAKWTPPPRGPPPAGVRVPQIEVNNGWMIRGWVHVWGFGGLPFGGLPLGVCAAPAHRSALWDLSHLF